MGNKNWQPRRICLSFNKKEGMQSACQLTKEKYYESLRNTIQEEYKGWWEGEHHFQRSLFNQSNSNSPSNGAKGNQKEEHWKGIWTSTNPLDLTSVEEAMREKNVLNAKLAVLREKELEKEYYDILMKDTSTMPTINSSTFPCSLAILVGNPSKYKHLLEPMLFLLCSSTKCS